MNKLYTPLVTVRLDESICKRKNLIILAQADAQNIVTSNHVVNIWYKYKELYEEIILISFSSIIKAKAVNSLSETKIDYDQGIDYNALNYRLVDILNYNAILNDIMMITNGKDLYKDSIEDSIVCLKSLFQDYGGTKIDKFEILLFEKPYDNNIIDKYKEIGKVVEKISLGIKQKVGDFDIEFVKNEIEFFNIFGFDNVEKKRMISVDDQLKALDTTILMWANNVVNKHDNYMEYIEDIIKRCKKLNLTTNNQFMMLNDSQNLYKKTYIEYINNLFKDDSILSKYIKRSNNVLMTSKYKNKFMKTIIKNIGVVEKLNKNSEVVDCFVEKHQDTNFMESLEHYYSVLTMTNWVEELEINSMMGLMLRVYSPNISKVGYNMDAIQIIDITTTMMPLSNILGASDFYYTKYHKIDDGLNENPMITGRAVGNGNCVFPLYICKEHWSLSKTYLKPMLGIIMAQNPAMYDRQYMHFPFMLLFDMVYMTFNKKNLNSKWIKCLLAVYQTCQVIGKECGFYENVNKIVKKFCMNPSERPKHNLNSLLGQIMIAENVGNDLESLCVLIMEENLRRSFDCKFNHNVSLLNLLKIDANNELIFDDKLFTELMNDLKYDISNIMDKMYCFVKFMNIIDLIKKTTCEMKHTFGISNDEQIKTYVEKNMFDDSVNILKDDIFDTCLLRAFAYKNKKTRKMAIKKGQYIDILEFGSFGEAKEQLINSCASDEKMMKTIKYLMSH